MATAASRADNASMELLAVLDREFEEHTTDTTQLAALAERTCRRTTARLVARMRARQERIAVYISRASGTSLLMLPYRRDEILPHVPEGARR